MRIRKLNQLGQQKFADFIGLSKEGHSLEVPLYLLTDHSTSAPISHITEIGDRLFSSRYEMGIYLGNILKPADTLKYLGVTGFWDWLSLFWFKQLCPRKDGRYSPRAQYHYLRSEDFRHRPRHAVYSTWQLVNKYQSDAAVLLSKMEDRGEIAEQIMSRQELWSSEAVVRLASELYYEKIHKKFKRGAAGKGAGSVRRYVDILQQLDRTYDLASMSTTDLIQLLPKEFTRFVGSANRQLFARSKSPILGLSEHHLTS